MDGQPSLTSADEGVSVLVEAGFLPDTAEYSTFIRHFPGTNAHPPWATSGRFWLDVKVYENGRLAASGLSNTTDEKGCLSLDLSALAESCGHPVKGVFVAEYHHAKGIPVELYAFHVHKKTGTYVSCNVTSFIGDELYPASHTDQMENTLFWPGMISDAGNEPMVVVVNPYDVSMGCQLHLMDSKGARTSTGTMHVKPKRAEEFVLKDLFQGLEGEIGRADGKLSLCVSSQYKLIAYVMFKSRASGVISMLDHLHTFCLA